VTLAALRAHIERWDEERADVGHSTERLFCHPDGSNIHPDTVTEGFQDHARAAGLPVIRLHDVRHSYATAALKAAGASQGGQRAARARDVAFTRTYSHVIAGMDAAAAALVAGHILGESKPPADGATGNGPVHDPVHKEAGLPPQDGDETGDDAGGAGWT
jgi:integrase